MDVGDLEIVKAAVARAIKECTDGGLLELIYVLLTSDSIQ